MMKHRSKPPFPTSDGRLNIVTRLPLTQLVTRRGEAMCIGDVGAEAIRNLLRLGMVRFVVADVGLELDWLSEDHCFEVWKQEVKPHLAEPEQQVYLEDFPDEYAYYASHWEDGSTPIVLLAKAH